MTDTMGTFSRRAFVAKGAAAASTLACERAWCLPRKNTRKRLFDGKTLNGWIEADNNATTISASSIPDPAAFVEKLAHGIDPVTEFLRGQSDIGVKVDASSDRVAGAALPATLKQINLILSGPLIYTAERFRGVTLRPETASLLKQDHRGYALARLNKMLLEDAFPAEINKSLSPGWVVKDGAIASMGIGRGVLYTAQDYSSYRLTYRVRHVLGHPDHQAGVLFFCRRPEPDGMPLDALGGIQFQLPMGSYWDYRPGNNNSGAQFFNTITKSPFDRHAWNQVELLVDANKGTARLAVAQPPGSRAIELVDFSDPTAGRTGPIAWQMHNAGLFDEYKDIWIEADPAQNVLISTR